jgi:predicted dehydrogenase
MAARILSVAFIGAGGVNFGGVDPGSPWDHASRLEVLSLEFSLKVVGISDPDTKRLAIVISERKGKNKIWEETATFTDYLVMLNQTKPDLVFIGIPPIAHGDIEINCASKRIHMFIEKPLSCKPPEFVEHINQAIKAQPGLIVSVGYMLRYHKALAFIKQTLASKNLKPIAISARYNAAYVSIPKPMWWDVRRSGGPVVEQATHFCDLVRYVGGEVLEESVHSVAVFPSEPIGNLSEIPAGCEVDVPIEFRINRATNATFKFSSGAVGTLQHALLMKGTNYFTEFEIWCDGLCLRLIDPYSNDCTVEVFGTTHEVHKFPDDPYLTEDRVFLNAVTTGNPDQILSSFEDATKTYSLAWKIQNPK